MRTGLFTRLSIGLTLILLLSLSSLAFLLLKDRHQQLITERTQQAIGQVKTLANGSLDALITKDYELLERWVAAVMSADYYSYAYLSSPNGIVLTHSDVLLTGSKVKSSGIEAGNDALVQIKLQYQSRWVNEVIYPAIVGNKTIAYAHLAWTEDDIKFINNTTMLTILGVIAVFLIILIPASVWLVRHYSLPFERLTKAITMVSFGEEKNPYIDKSLTQRNDEIGKLARAFQDMNDRLNIAWDEIQGEEQRLRKEVDKRTTQLQQSNAELESFSYSVSHDLRAPLRSIDGFSQILIEECASKLDKQDLDSLSRIREASQRMSALISSLLDLSRIGRAELTLETTNLTEVADKIIENMRVTYPQRQVDIHVANNIKANCDRNMIMIVLENLLNNAWKYSAKADNASIEFGCKMIDWQKIYFIRDNGAGFDMHYAGKLFGAFQRMHNDKEFEGTGIGLATVQRIIHRHHGRIWAEAAVNKGATFFFTLG